MLWRGQQLDCHVRQRAKASKLRRSRCGDAGWQAVRVAKLHATVMCVGSLSLCMPLAVILHVWCAHAGAHEHRR